MREISIVQFYSGLLDYTINLEAWDKAKIS